MNTTKVSNSLDPDQAPRFVGPDLGPNCLQRLSAEDTSKQRLNTFLSVIVVVILRINTFEQNIIHVILNKSSCMEL